MIYIKENTNQEIWSMVNSVRGGMEPVASYKLTVYLAFVKYSCNKNNLEFKSSDFMSLEKCVSAVEDEYLQMAILELLHQMKGRLDGNVLQSIADLLPDDNDSLTDLICDTSMIDQFGSRYFDPAMPKSVNKLVLDILNIQTSEVVGNLGCGVGNFISTFAKCGYVNELYAYEINISWAVISKMVASVLGLDAHIKNEDMLLCGDDFDKCFVNNPWGVRTKNLRSPLNEQFCIDGVDYNHIPRSSSAEWLFYLNTLSHLKNGGRAVGVTIGGPLYNSGDCSIRQMLIENGWIESVIALPQKLYSNTAVQTFLVVLSFNNEKIRFIDASDICDKGRRLNTINDEQRLEIINLFTESREGLSVMAGIDEIAEMNYALDPLRYLSSPVDVKNAVELGFLADVTRGSTWGRAKLEKYNSTEPTSYNYLELRHIDDGEIEEDLPYLTEIEPSQQRYCAEEGDIILSKMGPKFKVAVVGDLKGKQLLASGNLYILRIDKSKANPVYIKAFLETESGMAQLVAGSVGTTIPSVPVSALNKIKIPGLPLEEQNELVRQYEKLRRDNNRYAERIQLNKEKMLHLFDEI